jgi:tripartite-type tricarboxylate transporter receptor subunit TctC
VIRNRLNQELQSVLADPKFKDKLISQGADPMPGSAEQFGQFLKNEISRWNKIITQAGIVLE